MPATKTYMSEEEIEEILEDAFTEGPEEIWCEDDFYALSTESVERFRDQAKRYTKLRHRIMNDNRKIDLQSFITELEKEDG